MSLTRRDDLPRVAYFCMEYGLDEEFRTYAGGLGILAGDYLKSAKDLRVPVVGVGLLWHNGYTSQYIADDGRPYDTFPEQDCSMLKDTGSTISLKVRDKDLQIKVWVVDKYGNAPLYLLDTRLPGNEDAWICNQLYGGDTDERIAQEMVLGIGGVKVLRALNIPVDLYHFNEGHAVFAGLELIREGMSGGQSFEAAWHETRKHIIFTTHTPVPAGNESHDHARLFFWGASAGLNHEQLWRIGGAPFSMTVAGLRVSCAANGVSRLHGETARKMWDHVDGAAPITHVTNGVHNGTWQDDSIRNAFDQGENLWEPHQKLKRRLVSEVERRADVKLNPDVLTIGFARRAAPYKRHDLIFRHMEIIEPYLTSGRLQLVFAGRAHPNDRVGKDIIASLVSTTRKFPTSTVFLENYDIEAAQYMTRGCDVWLNNPVRPMEASGTSGMKAAMNGLPNVSTLDGWWEETCQHGECGWQIGDGYEGPDQDERDHHLLYTVLLGEIEPTYYADRTKWVSVMRSSIAVSHWNYSSGRMVEDYYNRLYMPALDALRANAPVGFEPALRM